MGNGVNKRRRRATYTQVDDDKQIRYVHDSSQGSVEPINLVYSGINKDEMDQMTVNEIYNKTQYNLGE